MAQTPEYYRDLIIDNITADALLAPLVDANSTAFNPIRSIAYAVGFVASAIDSLMDSLKTKTDEALAAKTPHQLIWYRTIALEFIYGLTLPQWSNEYEIPEDWTEEDIAEAMVVKYAAVTEDSQGAVSMKIATIDGDDLVPVDSDVLTAFKAYMAKRKDAGVWLSYINTTGDLVNITTTVYFNPQVMNPDGTLISDASSPVDDAIENYFKNGVEFNGEVILAALEDAIQAAEGVTVPSISELEVKPSTAASYTPVVIRYTPYSGYFNINSINITYIAEP